MERERENGGDTIAKIGRMSRKCDHKRLACDAGFTG
jgi:hypothetical protein